MQQIVLKAGNASATILPERGALVSSLILEDSTSNPHELLWLPVDFNPQSTAIWPGGGLPFLFPFAGRVWHQGELYKYSLESGVFDMPLHGFSWAKRWDVQNKKDDLVQLILRSDQVTQKIYPFHFEICLTIKLSVNKLHMAVSITHHGTEDSQNSKMPVAIGWHPYFRLGNSPTLAIPANTIYPVTPVGGADQPHPIAEQLETAPWSLPHPQLASLILANLSSEPSVLSPAPSHKVTIGAGPADLVKYIVTWSNRPTDFHCVEPWMSLPDAVSANAGVQWLEAGAKLALFLELECQ